ncbi:MAG: NAD(P)H-binding protein, partial [Henriciella sp.]|nr:NAD(P)H-binding protein [Henriciella sp.]
MPDKVIILGAKGRFGRAAMDAFQTAGWQVTAFARARFNALSDGISFIQGDASDRDTLRQATIGHDVIVNALNSPYGKWAKLLPVLTKNVIAAAKASGATVMLPGNVYNYGETMPANLAEDTPHTPSNHLGKLRAELEEAYAIAADDGVRTVILRGGDFIERAQTGNWFDTHITHKIAK